MTESGSAQPAGWYHAQGDPPGTQRYWDGAQWVGDPRAVGGDTPGYGGAGQVAMSGGRRRADAGKRFIAFLIDAGIGIGIYIVGLIVGGILGSIAESLGTIVGLIFLLGYLGYIVYNYLYLQGTTGQTIGKKMQGISLLRQDNGSPLGIGMVFVRAIVSMIFAIPCYLDHWWILVDQDNQRLSDKVLGFHVYDA